MLGGIVRNAISFDVEDWFHPEALRDRIDRAAWSRLEARAGRNVDTLLRVLDTAQVRATFFVLGWVAEREPGLVQRIAAEGHEVACHGFEHRMITTQTPADFAADLRRALHVLRAQSGQAVVGYRAPSFSIVRDTLWALDILLEHGIEYDSSIYPVHHDRYGIPEARRVPWRARAAGARELWELPPPTLRCCGRNLPAAGGGYLRLLPYAWSALALRRLNAAGIPGIVYAHPWEYDCQQPRLPLPPWRALRHYGRLATSEPKLVRLLREFRFTTCTEVLDGLRGTAAPANDATAPEPATTEAT